tara:strand:- start:32 stop:469 length:438 start_codon:yes stop_codon:yes gene_type:complete
MEREIFLMFSIFSNFIKKNNNQILKFIISGLIATGINFIVFSSIFLFLKSLIFASLCGYFSGLVFSFIFARLWVFKSKSRLRVINSFFVFSLIYLLGALEMVLIIVIINYLFNERSFAWFIGTLFSAINNYLGSKYLIFGRVGPD